jgi:hypothetical protein
VSPFNAPASKLVIVADIQQSELLARINHPLQFGGRNRRLLGNRHRLSPPFIHRVDCLPSQVEGERAQKVTTTTTKAGSPSCLNREGLKGKLAAQVDSN